MKTKLTKALIEEHIQSHTLTKGGKLVISDTEVRGLQAVIRSTGLVSFHLYYRTDSHAQRRPKIGEYPALSVSAARQKAQQWLAKVHMGQDPSAVREAQRRAPIVKNLIERYISDYSEVHHKPRTTADIKVMLETIVQPVLGSIKVTDVKRSDIEKLHSNMKSHSTRGNRVLSWLNAMFNKAVDWELRETNPCSRIKRYREDARERFLTDAELKAAGDALRTLELNRERIQGAIDAIRIIAMTGLRHGEVLNLRWANVDLQNSVLILHDSKTGRRNVNFGAQALALLTHIKENSKGELVVHGRHPDTVLDQGVVRRTWKKVCEIAKIKDARIHDLRHTYGTYASQAGANAFLIRDALGHKTLAMTDRYVSLAVDPLTQLKNKVENRVGAAMGLTSETPDFCGPEPDEKVIPLRRG
jgi:integrase